MNTFDYLKGNHILNVQRLDRRADYEYFSPYAIILTIENQASRLIITATDEDYSVDIKMVTQEQFESDFGLKFDEQTLNDLKKDDELVKFINGHIVAIKLAEYILPELSGPNFLIKQGRYAGIELTTDEHRLLFQNKAGGWLDVDNDIVELANINRCIWV